MAADITELLKELHKIVNEAICAQQLGENQPEGRYYDLSTIYLEKLRDEFAKKVKRKSTALQNIRELVGRRRGNARPPLQNGGSQRSSSFL
jgi:type I restriction enzyme R subunit